MKISVIIPVHNEEKSIQEVIKRVTGILDSYNYEIIVVDDNSDDSTSEILDKLKLKTLRVFHKKNNESGPSGLGAALTYGFNRATGDIIIPLMGDLSDDPKDILKMISKINDNSDVVCGSRFILGGKLNDYPKLKLFFNRLYNKFYAFLFGLKIRDISNAFKAYKKEVIDQIQPESKGFEITSEITLKAFLKGFSIGEVPVSWTSRKYGTSKMTSFNHVNSILFKIPKIGYGYTKITTKIYLRYLMQCFRRFFKGTAN